MGQADYQHWWKVDNGSTGLIDEIGSANLSLNGSGETYPTCKFNGGFYPGSNTVVLRNISSNPVSYEKGLVESWIKTDFNMVNGARSDSLSLGVNFEMFLYSGNAPAFVYCRFNPTQMSFIVRTNGSGTQAVFISTSSGLTWTAGDLVHFMFCWDKDGIGATSETMRIYVNGVKVDSSTVSIASSPHTTGQFYVGNANIPGTSSRLITDNVKVICDGRSITEDIIQYAVDNRNNEAWIPPPITPTNVIASNGLYEDKIKITWNEVATADTYNIYRSDTELGIYTKIQSGISALFYEDITAIIGNVYWYKVSSENVIGESSLSTADHGYLKTPVTPTIYPIIPIDCTVKRAQVLIENDTVDIYDLGFIERLNNITHQKTFKKDKLVSNEIVQEVNNQSDYFSVDSPKSVFFNRAWEFSTYKQKNEDGLITWDGIIKNIIRDHSTKKAKIHSVSKFYKFSQKKISYQSSTWETPSIAFKNICDQEGLDTYNLLSISRSNAIQESNGLFIKCDFQLSDDITFQQALEKLGEIGVADVYDFMGQIYYAHYIEDKYSVTADINLNETSTDIIGKIKVSNSNNEIINDYNISYVGYNGIPATDSNNNNIGSLSRDRYGVQSLPEFNGSIGEQIEIKDLKSAVYIGDTWIRKTHYKLTGTETRSRQLLTFTLPLDFKYILNLYGYVRVSLIDENWTDKIFELFKIIENNSSNILEVLLYEVTN